MVKGKYGVYCINKCGMNVSRVMGTALTDVQVKDVLAPLQIFQKKIKGIPVPCLFVGADFGMLRSRSNIF